MKENNKHRKLNEDELEQVSGGYDQEIKELRHELVSAGCKSANPSVHYISALLKNEFGVDAVLNDGKETLPGSMNANRYIDKTTLNKLTHEEVLERIRSKRV